MLPQRVRVEFTGSRGYPIIGRLDRPADPPRAYALFAHCFTCTKDLKAITWITRALLDHRIASLRFDFTGLGESGGEFADTNFTSNLDDLRLAAEHLRTLDRGPAILVGHSLGGTAVLAVASQVPEARLVATIAAPANTRHIREFVHRQTGALAPEASSTIDVMGRPIRIKGQLLDDLASHDIAQDVANLRRPLVVFHSPQDDVVDISHAHQIFDAARHPKSLVSLDGADHLLIQREQDARFVADVLVAWVRRCLTFE